MNSRPAVSSKALDIAAVALSFLLYSFIAAPIPALNEPHYLTKAKHFWQPAWCSGDFFLDSANAHTVFFVTVGWLTTWCSLPMTAAAGRVAALCTLAWGWAALSRTLELSRWQTVLSVWLFLALAVCGNWSGEWIVSGVESKVFAYGCLLWAVSQLPCGRWDRCALAMGSGTAFHPIVGLWGVLAMLGGTVSRMLGSVRDTFCAAHLKCAAKHFVVASAIFVLVALPGLIPVLRIVLEPVDARTRYAATYIQVYYRLGHHLDPMQFPLQAYIGYGALATVWLALWKWGPRGTAWSWLHRITLCSLLFALAGLAAGWGPRPPQTMPGFDWRMHLLKFYPFRLADALLPIVVSLQCARWASHWIANRAISISATIVLIWSTLYAAHQSTQEWHFARGHATDWRDACRWVREHTPPEALFITPHDQWSFKWYAERAEFVTFKDCPQDARGIVEWNRRQLVLSRWIQNRYADERYSREELDELQRLTGADFLVADKLGPIDAAPVYQNATHRVYDLHRE